MHLTRRALGTAAIGTTAAAGGWLLASRRRAPTSIVISSGPRRSVSHGWAAALAEQVERDNGWLRCGVLTSAGSIENLLRLRDGDPILGVASTDAAAAALRGVTPFGVTIPITALARVYDDYVHLVVRDDSRYETLQDLTDRQVAVGPPGSGTALVADRLLTDTGVAVRRLPLDVVEAGLALQGRRLDGLLWLGGLPTRALTELASRVRIRLLPLADVAVRLRARHGAAYRPAAIPPGTYGRAEGVTTVASANLLLCRENLRHDLVTTVLATAFRRRDAIAGSQPAANALDRRAAIATDPVPLHPAAARYYRGGKP